MYEHKGHRGAFAAFSKQNDRCPTNAWMELEQGGGGGGGGVGGGGGGGGGARMRGRYGHAQAIDLKRGISRYKHLSRTQSRA